MSLYTDLSEVGRDRWARCSNFRFQCHQRLAQRSSPTKFSVSSRVKGLRLFIPTNMGHISAAQGFAPWWSSLVDWVPCFDLRIPFLLL